MAPAKRTTSPAFQWYPKEFLSSTKVIGMSALERGVYITLLSMQWLDGSVPNDLPTLARLNGIPTKQFIRLWPCNLGRCFIAKNGGRLVNERLERERKKQADFRQKQQENAAKGWGSRRNASPTPEHATAVPPHPSGNAFLSPISYLQSASPIRDVRPASIIARRRPDAAWEGARGLYVPQRKHSDFIGLRDHPEAERELFAWYERVAETFQGSPGADMMRFWTARYDEQWPPAAPTKQTSLDRWAAKHGVVR